MTALMIALIWVVSWDMLAKAGIVPDLDFWEVFLVALVAFGAFALDIVKLFRRLA